MLLIGKDSWKPWEKDLMRLPKQDRRKIRVAEALRAGTAMTVGWIAQRVKLGSRQHATKLLSLSRKRARKSEK